MRRALQGILIVGGIAAVLIALSHIALGPASIPGSVPVNPTMDSEDRFYATLFLAAIVILTVVMAALKAGGRMPRFGGDAATRGKRERGGWMLGGQRSCRSRRADHGLD